ncbi:MAG: trimethylamine-N-oxide reductase TorA [Alphaproteobacteria bacterium]|nr:trimethylamine-N-oxide reductase TorA [Alphaproteobacteria bacterium]
MDKISRRELIQLSGTALASTMIPGAAAAAVEEKTVLTATHWGIVEAVTHGGRLVKTVPFAKDPAPTPMITAFPDRVHARTRVRYPMVRGGFLKHGAGGDTALRGADEFVRVSWNEALDLVANELKRVKAKYGNAAFCPGTVDWQSAGLLHNAATLTRRMLGLHGGFTDATGDPSIAAAMVILPHVVGDLEVYDQQTAWPTIIENSNTVVLWGCCLLKNDQIGTHPADHYAYVALKQLREKAAAGKVDIISIDPRITDTAQYLDAHWLAPRPNTDTALMLALMHTLYTAKKYDADFIKKYTYGFDEFLPYLLGKSDGTPKTPEWAAGITGLKAEDIVELAHRLARGRTMLISGFAIQRADHGEQPYWALVTLAAMLGQIGLPGGGFGTSYHYDNGGSLTAKAPGIAGISAGDNAIKTALPFERVHEMLLQPNQPYDYNGQKMTYADIKMIYWAGGNPMTHLWQTSKVIEAWRRPETVVVADPFWTPTARFADIVLPATTTFERNDIEFSGAYSQKYIVAMHKAVEPVGESRNDYDIMLGLAHRLGFADKFTEKKSEMDWLRSFYEQAQKAAKPLGVAMPEFNEFWNGPGYIEFPIPPDAKDYVKHADFRADPAKNPLGTPSGKIEIYSKTIAAFKYDDCPPHPTWIEPAEWLGGAGAQKHPLHIVSPHPKHRLHSQLDNTVLRHSYEIGAREPIWLNSDDAKARGIAQGDIVRVFNDRGSILAGAFVTPRMRPGVVCLHEGAWYDPDKPGKLDATCKHGLINVLTINKGTSKLAQGNIANTALVQVERYREAPPKITVFTPPRVVRQRRG